MKRYGRLYENLRMKSIILHIYIGTWINKVDGNIYRDVFTNE